MTSARVARALYELGFHTFHVGGADQPPFGTPDDEVLAHAKRVNETIVTGNYDLIMLCAEAGESVVWLDPRGPDMTLREIVLRCFLGIERWAQLLADADAPCCVRSLKTVDEVMPLERASRLARKRLQRRHPGETR